MTVRREGSIIHLEDVCGVEEAEPLAAILDSPGSWAVELSDCRRLHTALIQALIKYRPDIRGTPADSFLSRLVIPALGEPASPAFH